MPFGLQTGGFSETCTLGWMDGWMDGWVDGWMGGWMDGWMDGWVDGCSYLRVHGKGHSGALRPGTIIVTKLLVLLLGLLAFLVVL